MPRVCHLGRALRTPHSKSLLAAQSRRENIRDRNKGKIAHGLVPARPSLPPLSIGLLMVSLETLAVLYVLLLPLTHPLLGFAQAVTEPRLLLLARRGKRSQTSSIHLSWRNRRIGIRCHLGLLPGPPVRPHLCAVALTWLTRYGCKGVCSSPSQRPQVRVTPGWLLKLASLRSGFAQHTVSPVFYNSFLRACIFIRTFTATTACGNYNEFRSYETH